VNSQWLPGVVDFVILLALAVISFLATFRSQLPIERLCGIAGLLLFAFLTPLILASLYESAVFLDRFRESQLFNQ
jgi:hypothetical protein